MPYQLMLMAAIIMLDQVMKMEKKIGRRHI